MQLGVALMGEGWISHNSVSASSVEDVNIYIIFKIFLTGYVLLLLCFNYLCF